MKAWYQCTNPIKAPMQDLKFLQNAIEYAQTDAVVSNAVLKNDVPVEEKREMGKALQAVEPNVKFSEDRVISNPVLLIGKTIRDFVSYKTKNFFVAFGLSSDFLRMDPSDWGKNEDYIDALEFCRD
ncbi:uncharacterized protein LOC118740298 [Rhagoletis pomonella]|uniref:uncharacterized protein LOC118740298 n=1 Tax=Rhagoletis pomonella TaxID=28610 RepID=UPI00177FF775|nr:uncharacterized protein LOC118740298 [Rhagoletis pomonella]